MGVYLYDLTTNHQEPLIFAPKGSLSGAVISGNRIVWQKLVNGSNWDIDLTELSN